MGKPNSLSIYNLKPRFQEILKPLCAALARKGIKANFVTLSTIYLSAFFGMLLWLMPGSAKLALFMPLILALRMSLNAVDGILAKDFDQQSAAGVFYNELGDVICDICLYLPLLFWPGFSPAAVVLFVLGALVTEIAGLAALQAGLPRRYEGPMGKSDRAFAIGLICLGLGLGLQPGQWTNLLMLLFCAMEVKTIINRVQVGLAEAE